MRKLRQITGLTQKELAALAGSSEAYIGHIEARRSSLGPEIARRVAGATGAQFKHVKRDGSDSIEFTGRDWLGRKYTGLSFQEWRSACVDVDSTIAEALEAIGEILRSAFKQQRGYLCLGLFATTAHTILDAKEDKGQQALSNLLSTATPIPSNHQNDDVDEHRATFWTFGRKVSTFLTRVRSAHIRRPI